MKIIKGISIFFVCPMLFMGIGFASGFQAYQYFYPGDQTFQNVNDSSGIVTDKVEIVVEEKAEADMPECKVIAEDAIAYGEAMAVMASEETLCVDTEYVLKEVDVLTGSEEQSTLRIPEKYIGMNREQFLASMENYQLSPPLSELERGFVNLEVLTFSREKVLVQMNYKFVQPGKSFYLAVYDNRVVVYLEDKSTIYIETDILLENLSDSLQKNIIDMLYVESEEELYHLLESYSS